MPRPDASEDPSQHAPEGTAAPAPVARAGASLIVMAALCGVGAGGCSYVGPGGRAEPSERAPTDPKLLQQGAAATAVLTPTVDDPGQRNWRLKVR